MAYPLLIALLVSLNTFSAYAEELRGEPIVIDGDTVEVSGNRIRLHGIDTPESKQTCIANGKEWRCGEEATLALTRLIKTLWITCIGDERGKYGRLIAVCYSGPVNLNATMVREGWALAYQQYSKAYVGDESKAKEAGIGIWKGQFVKPWEWRRGKRLSGNSEMPECHIKGNVNSKGESIFHIPGGQFYNRVKINPSEGDKCFLSEEDAIKAGFRRSMR